MDVQNSINATFEDTTCLRDNETILKYPVYVCSQVIVRSTIRQRVYIWLRAPIAAQRECVSREDHRTEALLVGSKLLQRM